VSVQRPDATAEHTGTRVSADREHAIVLRQALFRLCECGNAGCTERVELTQGQYEEIRRHPTHFVVKPGHTSADVERVAETTNGYAVVEKFGESSLAAIRLDPRRSSGASLS